MVVHIYGLFGLGSGNDICWLTGYGLQTCRFTGLLAPETAAFMFDGIVGFIYIKRGTTFKLKERNEKMVFLAACFTL